MSDSDLLNNMITELRRGTLTLAVLSQLKVAQYGYSLLKLMEEKNTRIEASTLYPLLRRLESQGLLESQWDTAETRPRKYYTLSTKGLEFYNTLKLEWKGICDEMTILLKGEL